MATRAELDTRRAGRLGRVPLGILILAGLMALLGGGLTLAAAYLAVARPDAGWMVWGAAAAAGPVAIYFAVHLVRLSRWAWPTLATLLALLLVSSLVRAALALEVGPVLEVLAEILLLGYLARPGVRAAFGRE